MNTRVIEASCGRSQASFSAKFTPQWHPKHLSGLQKHYVAPYGCFSILGPTPDTRWLRSRRYGAGQASRVGSGQAGTRYALAPALPP
jgi:hypothetical protein